MKKIYLIICFFIGIQFVFSQKIDSLQVNKQQFIIDSNLSYEYSKPKFFDMFKYVPHDLIHLGKYLVNKDNFGTVALTTYSTVAMIPFDEQLTNAAAILGKPINLDNEGTYLRIKGARILPSNLPAAIYFIGNGGTTLLISGGFYAFGKINNDYRMLNTSSELAEVLMSVGIVTQTVKRITGRQSPVRAIADGNPSGNWTLFPNTLSYQQNTPNYDAMPSGHVATYIATLTVIATNYPEIKWIKPVGYSLGGLLAFQMVSSKVHWTSDYPLAVLFGYVVGKNIA
ncbi:MAG TPA: phosphatase PAP2 family protein, partial [Flavobacteriaceae bacterium]|nr:phosphatase PAP2 family protein [Flavobacteriaceae bacterium]